MMKKNKKSYFLGRLLLIVILLVVLLIAYYCNLFPHSNYSAKHFDIETVVSSTDYDHDGIDDYTDIMLGARDYVSTKPRYKSAYYDGGYPPNDVGVCTDVIWQAFKAAGYSLKDLLDEDVAKNPDAYPTISEPDPNIDFRRVTNLKIFFERHANSLTLDETKIAEWQAGDIVVYSHHIAIVSDKRNSRGVPFIIHNAGQPILEEDALKRQKIIGHYRWGS